MRSRDGTMPGTTQCGLRFSLTSSVFAEAPKMPLLRRAPVAVLVFFCCLFSTRTEGLASVRTQTIDYRVDDTVMQSAGLGRCCARPAPEPADDPELAQHQRQHRVCRAGG